MGRGRDYVTRSELVAEVERRFAAIDAMEGTSGTEQSGKREAEAGPHTGEGVGEGGSGPRPQLPLVRRRDTPTRPVPEGSVVTRDDVRRACSWCSRHKSKPLPPLTLEHRRSGLDVTVFLCATCSGPDSTVWMTFTRPSGPRPAAA
jgi:hypothetical protein